VDDLDDLTLMWQSAPMRRGPGVGEAEPPGFVSEIPPDPHLEPQPLLELDVERVPGPATMPDESLEGLEARICSLASRLASYTHDWLVLIAEFDRRKGWVQWGMKSCAHWLSWACSVTPGAAREYLRVASALTGLPVLDAAFGSGQLSYSKVRAVTRVADRVDEQTLLEQALVHTAAQLERVIRGYRKADRAGLDQQQRRRARWFFDDDGMLILTARLPADEGAIVVAALEQARQSVLVPVDDASTAPIAETDAVVGDQGGVERSGVDDHDLSEADALVAVAQNALAAGPMDSSGDDRHLLVLHVDAGILTHPDHDTDHSDHPTAVCRIENGPGVDRSTAERIACDAALVALIDSAIPGEQMRLGRKTRKISPALRRALRIRDGGCRFPGCHRQRHLEAHHVIHWLRGGLTDLDNLVLLCRRHHMAIHEEGFAVSWATPASSTGMPGWEFHRPDGEPVPANPTLTPSPDVFEDMHPFDPELLRPGWRGEPFGLADSVGVLCRASFPRATDPT
jgi:hypothetical protein